MVFYNPHSDNERIFDDMNNGFGWGQVPKIVHNREYNIPPACSSDIQFLHDYHEQTYLPSGSCLDDDIKS